MQRLLLRAIALSEVASALAGAALLFSYLIRRFGLLGEPVFLAFLAYLGLCFVAGIALWRGKRPGLWLSVLAQVPQLVAVGHTTWSYRLQAGPQLLWYLWGGPYWLWLGVHVGLDTGGVAPYLSINFAPVLALAILAHYRHEPGPASEATASEPQARSAA